MPCGSSYYLSLWEGQARLAGAGAVGIARRALPSAELRKPIII